MTRLPLIFLILAVAGCHNAERDQTRNFADPAVAEALSEPLMTDVDMRAAAAGDALRPADQAPTLQIPADAIVETTGAPTLGQVAARDVREPAFSKCNPAVAYSAQWSVRLPVWLDLPDGARLAEAAGSDLPACALRVVRFGVTGTPGQSLARYAALAKRTGFVVRAGQASLTATRASDGAAFRVDATAIANGTRIDLTSNRGA